MRIHLSALLQQASSAPHPSHAQVCLAILLQVAFSASHRIQCLAEVCSLADQAPAIPQAALLLVAFLVELSAQVPAASTPVATVVAPRLLQLEVHSMGHQEASSVVQPARGPLPACLAVLLLVISLAGVATPGLVEQSVGHPAQAVAAALQVGSSVALPAQELAVARLIPSAPAVMPSRKEVRSSGSQAASSEAHLVRNQVPVQSPQVGFSVWSPARGLVDSSVGHSARALVAVLSVASSVVRPPRAPGTACSLVAHL